MSEMATYLKVGTTALILDMIEDGFFDRDYSLQSPVQAIRDISHDPTLRETVGSRTGAPSPRWSSSSSTWSTPRATCQRIDADPVTRDVLARWTDVLEQLQADPMQLNREVDWVIKKRAHRELHGEEPAVVARPQGLADRPAVPRHPAGPRAVLQALRQRHGRPHHHRRDHRARQAQPPQTTRARLRGEFIRQANLKGKDYRVDWVYLKLNDPERETILCKDPFQSHDERVERLIRSF